LHSSVPSVAVVYATLRRQSARFRCRSLTSSLSTIHVSWARTSFCTDPRFQEPTRSWRGCYLYSSVPSVPVVYATLRRQSARFRCRPPANSPSTLHVSWVRTSSFAEPRFQEPTRSCFLLAFHVKLFQSSTRVWPVIITFVHSPAGTGRDAVGFQRQTRRDRLALYLIKTNTMKTP